ncbi:hypothetical protein LIER_24521 [Lithospermum erythrorhizon]|uniref:Uncharacterized protein n=1 Tax=Lithospermum erythrorhizon TaxID=34254 RepID=A0AAV3R4Q1_LITER
MATSTKLLYSQYIAQLSSVYQDLHRSATYAQQVVKEFEDRAIALVAAKIAEEDVERLSEKVVDLKSQRLSAGSPLSWRIAGAILNFQEKVLSLPFKGEIGGSPPFFASNSV